MGENLLASILVFEGKDTGVLFTKVRYEDIYRQREGEFVVGVAVVSRFRENGVALHEFPKVTIEEDLTTGGSGHFQTVTIFTGGNLQRITTVTDMGREEAEGSVDTKGGDGGDPGSGEVGFADYNIRNLLEFSGTAMSVINSRVLTLEGLSNGT